MGKSARKTKSTPKVVAEYLTIPQYAKHAGVTQPAIRSQTAKGVIPLHTVKGFKWRMVKVAEADAIRAQRPPPNPAGVNGQGAPGGNGSGTFSERREIDLELKRLELMQKQGAVVDREAAKRVLFQEMQAVRDSWLNWPARVAANLAARLKVKPSVMQKALDDVVHTHLEEMGEAMPDDSAFDKYTY